MTKADLLVVGGPTHLHGMSNTSSRKMAADAASKPGSGLTLEPDSVGPGLRDWLHEIGHGHGEAIRARTWGAALAVASGAVSHAPRAETQ